SRSPSSPRKRQLTRTATRAAARTHLLPASRRPGRGSDGWWIPARRCHWPCGCLHSCQPWRSWPCPRISYWSQRSAEQVTSTSASEHSLPGALVQGIRLGQGVLEGAATVDDDVGDGE